MIDQLVLTEQDYEWPSNLTEEEQGPVQLSDAEVSAFIASGVLTEEAWQAHLAGNSWEIQVR